jgi:glucosylceramidase
MHQSAYWVLGHFARFIRPGARRVHADATAGLEATAYRNADSTTAVVLSHRHDEALRFSLCVDGRRAAFELPPRSIATFVASSA